MLEISQINLHAELKKDIEDCFFSKKDDIWCMIIWYVKVKYFIVSKTQETPRTTKKFPKNSIYSQPDPKLL